MYPDELELVWRTERGQTDRALSLSNGKISLKLLNPFNKLDNMSKFRQSVGKLLIALKIIKLIIHFIKIENETNGLWNHYWTNISDIVQDIFNKYGLSNFFKVVISVSLKRVNHFIERETIQGKCNVSNGPAPIV